jgi:very-short-patch-repair endonuclease
MDSTMIRDQDWGDLRSKAEWTIGFLEEYQDQPPEPLIRAATVPEIRGELEEAVRRNLAIKSDSFLESWKFLTDLFDPEQEVSTGIRIGRTPIGQLSTWVGERAKDANLIREWVDFGELRQRIVHAGLSPLLAELSDRKLDVKDAGDAFLTRFYRSWLDWVYGQDASLRRFSVEDHERAIQRFRSLDKDSIRLAFTRIRAKLLNGGARPNANSLDAPSTSELGILLREMNKKKRHLALRHLFARIPTVLARLKPCLMMSPLAVSTYLETKNIRFDVVIFDEASQVRPYDAISAIYRGKQLVVAGDQKQLPPTSFFERAVTDEDLSSDESEFSEELKDFESILDVCGTLGLARRRLRWHYRSKREPLIAFSNRHIYDGELVTFPSVLDTGATPAIRFEFVEAGKWKSGTSGGFNAVEAKRTAEMVLEHFRENPSLSLGVIAFSQRQQMAIWDELEQLRRLQPMMEGFFEETVQEPFFVKNLENVQGDERDVIFLSVGYGPDENGRVAMRFGPLNLLGGERRLNVAVTRSRFAMSVISSLKSHDIDLSRTKAVGARLLRDYLDFAERGIIALGSEITQVNELDYDSPFEKEVADALTRRGLTVKRQVGCSGFRIDLALVDPKRPGRFLLGIECDGATYHNSATARDRDRLRQEVLESLDWTIVRIWSTDWVKNPNAQIDRVIAALEQAGKAPRKAVVSQSRTSAKVQRVDETPVKINPIDKKPEPPGNQYTFDKIDDVPESIIEKLVLSIIGSCGATEEGDLKQAISRQLGFKRTGKNIDARLEQSIASLIRARKLVRIEGGSIKLSGDQSRNSA